MIYNIWSEGFIVMEARDGASCMGKSKGRNFREACKNFMKHHDPKNEYYDSKNNTYWVVNYLTTKQMPEHLLDNYQ